jgi:DNA-directed RNA polymerase specialized sigma24 family protein
VTRNGVLEALFRYPTPGPDMLFPWMRETISWRALDVLRADLAEIETTVANRAEAEAIQAEIAGFDQEPPALADGAGLRAWQRRVPLRDLYEAVEEFYREDGVRKACRAAIGRLASRAPREAEVIEGIFYEERTPTQLAVARGVKRSTIDNAKSHATRHLGEDDSFFYALHRFGIVRDRARATSLVDRYPSGRLPDGRRIVSIAEAA